MKKKKKQKKLRVDSSSALQLAKAAAPRQARFSGYGVHGDTKYNRRKTKRDTWREIARYL